MVNKNEEKEIKALIEEEKKFLEFFIRYEKDVVSASSQREWEMGVDDCLDNLISYYQLLKKYDL